MDSYNIPDRSRGDFYCQLCDARMNNGPMWDLHISGKRHIRNTKKMPGEMPSKVKAVSINTASLINEELDNIHEPVVGLDFIVENRRGNSSIEPFYHCCLCQGTYTMGNIVEHILSSKHRAHYLRQVDPDNMQLIEGLNLPDQQFESLVLEKCLVKETSLGRGNIEVKLEKTHGVLVMDGCLLEQNDEKLGRSIKPFKSECGDYKDFRPPPPVFHGGDFFQNQNRLPPPSSHYRGPSFPENEHPSHQFASYQSSSSSRHYSRPLENKDKFHEPSRDNQPFFKNNSPPHTRHRSPDYSLPSHKRPVKRTLNSCISVVNKEKLPKHPSRWSSPESRLKIKKEKDLSEPPVSSSSSDIIIENAVTKKQKASYKEKRIAERLSSSHSSISRNPSSSSSSSISDKPELITPRHLAAMVEFQENRILNKGFTAFNDPLKMKIAKECFQLKLSSMTEKLLKTSSLANKKILHRHMSLALNNLQ